MKTKMSFGVCLFDYCTLKEGGTQQCISSVRAVISLQRSVHYWRQLSATPCHLRRLIVYISQILCMRLHWTEQLQQLHLLWTFRLFLCLFNSIKFKRSHYLCLCHTFIESVRKHTHGQLINISNRCPIFPLQNLIITISTNNINQRNQFEVWFGWLQAQHLMRIYLRYVFVSPCSMIVFRG